MKKMVIKFFVLLAVFPMVSTASALTIVPTWDVSITTNVNADAITNGIMTAIQALESSLNNNLTVQILFVNTNVGLGESSTWYVLPSYASYLAALRAGATSVNDSNALRQLPNGPNDPVVGTNKINLQLPLARLLGFYSGYGPDGYDSTILLNLSLINLTRPPANPNKFDLISVAEHEIDETLGFVSTLDKVYPTGPIGPMDLFRYTTNLVRTWTTNGDNAYFSVDGTNLLARFNQNAGGDYHDWWSHTNLWAPPGVTPYPQVQDAYATPGATPNLGSNELAGLDIIGYTLAPPAAVLSIAVSGKNRFTLTWPSALSGYELQQRTNLLKGVWGVSLTGSTNPAVIAATNPVVFFRLCQTSSSPAVVQAQTLLVQGFTNPPVQRITHEFNPGTAR